MSGLPTCLQREASGAEARLQLRIDAEISWFEGHFEEHAILPGVVQIAWVVHYAREVFGLGPNVAAMEQVKFKRPIGPGQVLNLVLSKREDGAGVRYEYRDADTSYSSGILKFA